MTFYFIFIVGLIILSLFRLSLNTILLSISITYIAVLQFNYDEGIFLLSEKLQEVLLLPEVTAIPFFIISSDIIINSGLLNRFKSSIFSLLGNNLISFLAFSLPTITVSSTSMVFFSGFEKSFSPKEFKTEKDYIKAIFLLSSANYILPVSIPIIIIASLLKISLKTTIIYSLLVAVPFIIISYYLFVKNKLNVTKGQVDIFSIVSIYSNALLIYFLIFIKSYPIDIVAIISFLYSLFIAFLYNKNRFLSNLIDSLLQSMPRTGIITGIVYFIFLVTFFHIYNFANQDVINYLTLSFSEVYYMIIILYIVAFFMKELIDPLGIILILYPIYNSILSSYNINKYSFVVSFTLFVSMGIFNNISELAGQKITEKMNINFWQLYETIMPIYLIICILTFLVYFI
ncbi:MAG: hypothetical protein N3C60_00355 [Calditerrivibrio sp.]|nr:hypothetical protein [Calditerrivibrio sp.]